MSRTQRLVFVGAAVVVVIVAVIVITSTGGDSKSKSTAAKVPAVIQVKDGKPVGGITKMTVDKGDPIRFTVKSDAAQEIHVHGYDFHKDVPAGGQVSFDFPAKIEGAFIAEVEDTGTEILSLRVNP